MRRNSQDFLQICIANEPHSFKNFCLKAAAPAQFSTCIWAGLAEIGCYGDYECWSYYNGRDAALDVRITAHELGHNVGLMHASAICEAQNLDVKPQNSGSKPWSGQHQM